MNKLFWLSVLIIILFTGIYFGIGLTKTVSYRGPTSDHFDGKLFFNPPPYQKHSGFALWRWWFSRDRQPWPKQVANEIFPPPSAVTDPEQVRVTFINHATVLLQTKELTILTDPIWSLRASPFRWLGPKRVRAPGVKFADLPPIDIVLISHNHYDHLDIPTLKKLDAAFHPLFIVPLGDKELLNYYGIKNVLEMDWWQQYKNGATTITFLPAQHWSARWLNDKFHTLWGSYGIAYHQKKIYFAGDVGFSERFAEIRQRWGQPDLAFLPIGSYLPRWFMAQNHLNPEEAVQAHLILQAKHSIGIHFGTFQLSDESIDQPVKDLNAAIIAHQLKQQDFFTLKAGESKNF